MSLRTSFLPVYDFSLTINNNYLKQILPLMVQHGIAANPINYAICYDYVAGNNPGLRKAVDSAILDKQAFDADISIGIYKKYVCNASLESFEKINHQIQKVLAQTSAAVNDTCHKAEETNDRFQKKTEILEHTSEAEAIKSILREIIQETQSLTSASQTMQAQLHEADREMARLRNELNQVRQMAMTDGLTGLLNRRAFDQTLAEVIDQPETGTTHLSLLDIDHFKRINDSYGHNIGDHVIKFVASLMKKHSEAHHHVARYGGEELAIIMPRTSREKALEISESIRNALESTHLKRKDNNQPLGTITLSVGIAELQPGDDPESLLIRADKALYQAKESGRNKVVLWNGKSH